MEGRRSVRGRHRDVDVIVGLHLGCSALVPPTNKHLPAPLRLDQLLSPGWPLFWTSTHNPRADFVDLVPSGLEILI